MLLEGLSYYVHDAGIYTGCFVWKWFNSIFFIFVFVLFFFDSRTFFVLFVGRSYFFAGFIEGRFIYLFLVSRFNLCFFC
jgi:hypothetical protein